MLNWSKKAHTELELCKCRFKFIQIAVCCTFLLEFLSKPNFPCQSNICHRKDGGGASHSMYNDCPYALRTYLHDYGGSRYGLFGVFSIWRGTLQKFGM